MPKLRRRFTKEEKLQIVNESLEDGASILELSERYQIHKNTIGRWRRELSHYATNAFPGRGNKKQTAEQRSTHRKASYRQLDKLGTALH